MSALSSSIPGRTGFSVWDALTSPYLLLLFLFWVTFSNLCFQFRYLCFQEASLDFLRLALVPVLTPLYYSGLPPHHSIFSSRWWSDSMNIGHGPPTAACRTIIANTTHNANSQEPRAEKFKETLRQKIEGQHFNIQTVKGQSLATPSVAWPSSIGIPWELVRRAESQAPSLPQTYYIREICAHIRVWEALG